MSKREEIRNRRNQSQRRQKFLLIGIIGAFALVMAAVLIIPNLPKDLGDINGLPEGLVFPNANENTLGNPNAKVVVEEFADFQCPWCAKYATEMEQEIIQKYVSTDQVYYRFIPFSFIGKESFDAAEAAYCAMDQGKFWEYREIVFANHNGENGGWYTTDRLNAFAARLNMNTADFEKCLSSGKYSKKVEDDVVYSKSKGVSSTPSFIINGKLVSMSELAQTIDEALAE